MSKMNIASVLYIYIYIYKEEYTSLHGVDTLQLAARMGSIHTTQIHGNNVCTKKTFADR